MSYETLEIVRAAGVATIWMNRPDVHNAFNAQLIADLTTACIELDADEAVRAVVLAGRGKSFSAGADLNWMKAAGEASEAENFADAMRLAGMLRTLAEMNKPTIARVHGAALGGGMGLASACDICIAGDKAVFATSEVKFGIIPSAISPYVIRAIGERQATRYFQTAERIGAARAAELGLAHEAVASEELDAKVKEVVEALLQGGPKSQAAAKDLIRAVANRPLSDALVEDTARRIASLRATPEAKEGLAAFLDKRPAAWIAQA
ncbi:MULTISPECIES: enoyl-CoA hydratase/isomerase family protein [Thauera]|jgi:methylglutaconyl-CoA hydratase|uniref:Enoyl-CoA hydratase n=2 Tax=Thauera aminoaromatica TaxID=164330 RepID=N6YVV8_THASP|nr:MULTISPECIES: enoyl-CoA hydratase/isomerase family protein [Thauera]MDA0236136.1 enoyl-CoA hydratase/isomerase family protein [Pseudomonadota bacterium]ACK53521.1 Enoyl-CoA hydratase/isomerase [Thauera aminoaromatica]ENO84094.1 enoyl-CoA hydratase [Thauera aminoaromatica S2]KIN89819.1 enoyl-CoA hydratase/isomerase family protein [Thauera sp. SWB20]MBP6132019.1 enoyl-CoA hydratase/isomerase family protein [Thauera sp.]